MTAEEAFEALVADENLAEMNRIANMEDPILQGYESAPMLSKITNQSPKTMAFRLIRASHKCDPNRSDNDVWRDIGVLKWCFDNWEK